MRSLRGAFTAFRAVCFAAMFTAIWAWLAISARRFDGSIPIAIPRWLGPLGAALAAGGAAFSVACIATFAARGHGTPAPFDPPRVFVASGPYRYVRNPMYIGGAAVILGIGLLVRSPSILLTAIGSLIAAHLFVILYEEPALTERFGDTYGQYRASVHRWIIRRPKHDSDKRGV